MTEQYNLQAIRELITKAFNPDGRLNLASDLFPSVFRSFAPGMTADQQIRAILEYAGQHGRIEDLLKYTHEHNPHQYNLFEPRLRRPKEIVDLEDEVARQQQVLARYEELETLETDSESRGNLQENIEKTKTHLLELQTKIAQLRKGQQPQPQIPLQSGETIFLANTPYGLETKLVGREDEMLLLDDWFHHDQDHPFLAVIGLGGVGKSALTWAWLQRLWSQKQAPHLVIWWSFYETDGTMDKLLTRLLHVFDEGLHQFVSLRAAVDRCTYYLQRTPTLLVLDGAERLLRAYGNITAAYQADALESGLEFPQARQCVDPAAGTFLQWLAQPGLTQAATLMTSRLLPRELTGRTGGLLAGVRRHDLTGLTVDAAVELFRQSGIKVTRAEVVAVAEPLGFHPLSLRLLAGYVANDLERPNDLRAVGNYDLDSELFARRTHILKRAYESLPLSTQHILSQMAAFRGGVDWPVIEAVFGSDKTVRDDLRILEQRGLIQRSVQPRIGKHNPNTNTFQITETASRNEISG